MRWLAAVVLVPTVASAQAGRPRTCDLVVDPIGSSTAIRTGASTYTTWYGGGFRARCRGTTMVVTSDSAEYVQSTRVMTLVGNARYREDNTTIDANMMRYTEFDARVYAEGNVRARMPTGSTLNAEQLHYFRAQLPARPQRSAQAYGRANLVLRDSLTMPDSLTTRIEADRLYMQRDSLFFAGGRVTITRSDIIAKADSAETNTGAQTARLLRGEPTVDGRGARTFHIEGERIDIFGRNRRLERLLSKGDAVATSDSLRLSADSLDIRTVGTQIEQVLAWGPGRARVVSPGRDVEADRIEIAMPGQRMRELRAFGRAFANTRADSAISTKEPDRIAGDTLVATFDAAARGDSTSQPPLKSLIARGNASAFFQMAARNARDSLPTLNYAVGTRIDMLFADSEVMHVQVVGQVRGINLSPVRRDTLSAPVRRNAPHPPAPAPRP